MITRHIRIVTNEHSCQAPLSMTSKNIIHFPVPIVYVCDQLYPAIPEWVMTAAVFFIYPVPVQQSPAKPYSGLLSEWGKIPKCEAGRDSNP